MDRNAGITRADVLCDLDRFPYPFRDSSFGELRAIHVIEHVSDVIGAMEEFHRVLQPGGEAVLSRRRITPISARSVIPRIAGT